MANTNDQIAKYEAFINDRLHPTLSQVLADRDVIYDRIAEFLKLRNNLEVLDKQPVTSLKTQVDLGANFYVQAHVPDTRYIFVSVGYGFHLQMTRQEAVEYIAKKEKQLQHKANKLTDEANSLRAQIRTFYLGIAELMQLSGMPSVSPSSSTRVQ
ncbi:hypothetical protein IWQ61_005361 [Dispira simplex]|nr:hypothetical protein IWQ61_005361 [Dispira simplex]